MPIAAHMKFFIVFTPFLWLELVNSVPDAWPRGILRPSIVQISHLSNKHSFRRGGDSLCLRGSLTRVLVNLTQNLMSEMRPIYQQIYKHIIARGPVCPERSVLPAAVHIFIERTSVGYGGQQPWSWSQAVISKAGQKCSKSNTQIITTFVMACGGTLTSCDQ